MELLARRNLFHVENDDYRTRVAAAEAELSQRESELWRKVNGAGQEECSDDEPSERVDSKILETLVELDSRQQLPLGLRVDSYAENEVGWSEK